MRALEQQLHRQVLDTRGVRVSARAQDGPCPRCVGPMVVEKTGLRHVMTLAHGAVEVRETVLVCQNGCRHENGLRVRRRGGMIEEVVPPGGIFGYDVMVHVGIERFLHHRQREEIREGLAREHGIPLSAGEVSHLAKRFLDYLRALHEARSPALADALRSDGGWPLHVDATGEDGRGTLLVAFAGWRQWVLGAGKIPTERADAILPHLLDVVERFGDPCAVMRDLGRAMIPSVAALVAERKLQIPVLSCHQHFLADLGGDILTSGHDELRESFRRSGLRSALRKLARDLGRKLGKGIDAARNALLRWQEKSDAGHQLPGGSDGLAVVRGLAQWVLYYQADSTYRSFPFDRPWLDLYERSCVGRRAADAFLRCPPNDRTVRSAVFRFCRALDPVVADERCARVAAALRKRAAIFDELRGVLRILPKSANRRDHGSPGPHLTSEEASAELRDIRGNLDRWTRELAERRPARGPAEDLREAIDEILAHLGRHGSSLWGHAIVLPPEAGGGVRLVDRTNNSEENFFRGMKHGQRRRSGRKVLTQDFESMPPEAALAENLRRPDYVAILCGSLEGLPVAFAHLDAQRRDAEHSEPCAELASPNTPPLAVESASLPTADRLVVRTDAMNRRLRDAARSRPPRTANVLG